MITRFFFAVTLVLMIGGCVTKPQYKGEKYALLKSSHAIISVNGEPIDASYKLDIRSGQNSIVVRYPTYLNTYFCEFVWEVRSGTTYEITDHEDRYPLTLYRWKRQNDWLAKRLDPIDPRGCSIQKSSK
jgi:hypothetical protein